MYVCGRLCEKGGNHVSREAALTAGFHIVQLVDQWVCLRDKESAKTETKEKQEKQYKIHRKEEPRRDRSVVDKMRALSPKHIAAEWAVLPYIT